MRDIPYTSKLDHAEDGRPLAFDLTTEPERIYTLADKLSRNSVTPATLLDIVDDWL